MKLELKENMYIRTKDGIIDKVIIDYNGHCASPNCECKHISCAKNYYDEDKIVKASYNIIDILECGDIIKLFIEDDIDGEDTNIFELIAINYNDNEIGVFNSDFQIEFFPIENLRGILTHEQMEQMEYKVVE